MKYGKKYGGRMGVGVEVKMDIFRDQMVMKTATEKKNMTTAASFFEN